MNKDKLFYFAFKNNEERVNIINFASEVLGLSCDLNYSRNFGNCIAIDYRKKGSYYQVSSGNILMVLSPVKLIEDADINIVKQIFNK